MASGHVPGSSPCDSMMVNVWFRSHQTSYQLQSHSTVAQLRHRLAHDHSVPPPEIKILLGGQLLEDDLTIEGSGVGMESTLFAIQRRSSPTPATSSSSLATTPTYRMAMSTTTSPSMSPPTSGTTTVTTATAMACSTSPLPTAATTAIVAPVCLPTEHLEQWRKQKDQFYVYCKLCGEVRPGRLRVKCSLCEGGAVLLDKGPGCWEDVLTPGRLTGSCQSLHCENCTPIFYFKCAEHHTTNTSGTVVALCHISPNRDGVLCLTCEDALNPVLVFPCTWSHAMCVGCFITYCKVRLKERGFRHIPQYGYTLPCPAGCADSFIQEQHHFCLLGGEQYDRYKDFAAEECVLAEGGVFCPQNTCGSGFLLDTPDTCLVCPHCQFVFCRNCRQPAHEDDCSPLSCTAQECGDAGREQQTQREQETLDTIQKTTKGCPGCGTRTERDGGCMHMRCARCGEQWCWLCVKAWDRQCQGEHWFG